MILILSAAIVFGGYSIRASAEEGEESSAVAAVKAIALSSSDNSDVLMVDSLTFGATSLVSLYDVREVVDRSRDMELTLESETQEETEDGTLVTRTLLLDDIPLMEVYIDDGEEKPLLLFLHGIGLDKESVLPYLADYAAAGYHAVSMDAYGQGERSEEGILYDDWASVLVTVSDIDQVVEFYGIVPDVSTEDFVLGGFSMGGIETWVYAELGSYTPAALLPISGICETDAWNEGRLEQSCIAWLTELRSDVKVVYQLQADGYTQVKYATISGLDVTENLGSFADIPIFMAIGTEDYYFSSDGAQNVIEAIREAGNENAVISVYRGVPHTVTPEMVADSIAFLQEVLGDI
ncbi:MAG: alpha/beta hydrolase [Oscillospiraceae bacterium]|nr:alpha/beta hydrolase [Oscillospiraceae bacterium]